MQAGSPDLSWIDHGALKRSRCAPYHMSLLARSLLWRAIRFGQWVVEVTDGKTAYAVGELRAAGCTCKEATEDGVRTATVRPSKDARAVFVPPDGPVSALEVQLYETLVSVYCRVGRPDAIDAPFEPRDVPAWEVCVHLAPYGYDMADRGPGVVLMGLRNERGDPMRVMRDRPLLRHARPPPGLTYFWPY